MFDANVMMHDFVSCKRAYIDEMHDSLESGSSI